MAGVGPVDTMAARRLDGDARRVIARSRRDTLASVSTSDPSRRWWTRRLADPHLEALRRYVVLLRRGGDDWASEAANTLVRIGYTIDQVAHARWLVGCETPDPSRARSSAALLLLAKALLLTGLLLVHASPFWPVALVLGLAAIVAPETRRRSRWSEGERNFIVV